MTPVRTDPNRMLVAEQLVKRYRGRAVVHDVSLDVAQGEIVGLLGPNGAGKTTTFYMVVGLVPADGGRIRVGDSDLTKANMHQRARKGLGYLPQEASIFRKLSVADNIMAILQLRKDLNRQERRNELGRLMDELHVSHLADQAGVSLSGGERRRVEIARALAGNPDFILLDEPFAGVDPISVGEIQRIVKQLAERHIGVLITDHNVRETLGICDRAYIISEGRVLTHGKPNDILADENVRNVYLGQEFRL
jgi:lipopolysaccharide export system ATP-binding protein